METNEMKKLAARKGFVLAGDLPQTVHVGDFYLDKNGDGVVFASSKDTLPCDCDKCGSGKRLLVHPIGYRR